MHLAYKCQQNTTWFKKLVKLSRSIVELLFIDMQPRRLESYVLMVAKKIKVALVN